MVVGVKSRREEIESFIDQYERSITFTDVPVSVMRHIIPLLLVDIYPQQYGYCSRKGEIQSNQIKTKNA